MAAEHKEDEVLGQDGAGRSVSPSDDLELEGAAFVDEGAHTGLEGIDDSGADETAVEGAAEPITDEDPDEIEDIAVVRFNGHQDSVYSAALHPTMPIVASGDGDDTFLVWDAAAGEILHSDIKKTHGDSVMFSQFSPDGKYLVTCSMDCTIQVHKVRQGGAVEEEDCAVPPTAPASTGTTTDAVSSSDGGGSSAGPSSAPSGSIRLEAGHALVGPGGDFNFAVWHPTSPALLIGSEDCMGWVFDARNGKLIASLAGHDAGVLCGCFSPKGNTVVTGSADGTIRAWHPLTGECKMVVEGRGWFEPGEPVVTLACHPTQSLVLAGAADGTARLGNYKSGRVIATYSHTKRIGSTAIGGSGTTTGVRALVDDPKAGTGEAGAGAGAATGRGDDGDGDGNDGDGEEVDGVKTSDKHDGADEEVAVSVEGVGFCTCGLNWAATGATDGSLCIWDLGSNSMRRSFTQEGSITSIQWHPDLAVVITAAADGTLRVFDARAGKELSRVAAHSGMVLDMQMWRAPAEIAVEATAGAKGGKASAKAAAPASGEHQTPSSGAGAGDGTGEGEFPGEVNGVGGGDMEVVTTGEANSADRFKPGQLYVLTAGDDHSCAIFELHG